MFVYTLQTKLELESMRQPQSQQQPEANKSNIGSSLFGLSSKLKAVQSNINTKLQTAGIQINNLNRLANEETIDLNEVDEVHNAEMNGNGNGHDEHSNASMDSGPPPTKTVDKETRRLRDDIESLQTQMANLKEMLKQSMEEKDQLQKGVFYLSADTH